MAKTLTPILSGAEPYSFGFAETYSYVPISNDQGRPLYAKAAFLVNPDDIKISLSASRIDVNFENVNQTLDDALVKLDTIHFDLTSINTDLNTDFSSLTSITQNEFDQTQTLLNTNFSSLTSITQNEFDQTQTLLNTNFSSLTSITQNEFDQTQTLLNTLNSSVTALDYQIRLQLGQNGFVFADNISGQVSGQFTALQVVSATRFSGLTATNTTIGNLTAYDLPQGMTINGPINAFRVSYGSVIAYNR